jgi:hypothetical protein
MKTIGRILLILLAVTAVASLTYALGQTQFFSQQLFAGGRHEDGRPAAGDFNGSPPPFAQGDRPGPGEGFGLRGGERGRDGFNLFAAAEFARTLIPIMLITVAVVLLTKLGDRVRKRRQKGQIGPPTNLTNSA